MYSHFQYYEYNVDLRVYLVSFFSWCQVRWLKRWDFFYARWYIRFILGRQPIMLVQMSYSRDASYGRGRGRSYGGGGDRSFNRGSPATKPVEVGKEYEVEVTEISRKGDGIARIQGFVIFVKNGKAGQKVKVKVEQVGNRFAIATNSDLE
jgi:predicted RNA-binding protein with TRAM domain